MLGRRDRHGGVLRGSVPGMARIGFLNLADMQQFYAAVADPQDAIFTGWRWSLWADGDLRGEVHFPASHISWAASLLAAQPSGEDGTVEAGRPRS
jgi:hypothetical protein